jgi:IS5 family transposase
MGHFPPGKGGGEGVAHGRQGKGILIHSLMDAAGMPLSTCTTPANGDERAQVLPLLDACRVHTGKRGRPRKRLEVLAADKGYDAKVLRHRLRSRGIRPQIPKRVWKTKKPRGRPLKRTSHAFKLSEPLPGSSGSTVAWLFAGNVSSPASTRFSPSL